jgi:hypothetical protein
MVQALIAGGIAIFISTLAHHGYSFYEIIIGQQLVAGVVSMLFVRPHCNT